MMDSVDGAGAAQVENIQRFNDFPSMETIAWKIELSFNQKANIFSVANTPD